MLARFWVRPAGGKGIEQTRKVVGFGFSL